MKLDILDSYTHQDVAEDPALLTNRLLGASQVDKQN
jgi:hypothetical protein